MKRIAVVGGGYSAEREISLRSAINVYEALKNNGHEVEFIDLMAEPDQEFINSLKKYDLVMPILHGRGGEDGVLQQMLDDSDIKYFGSGAEASKKAFDKAVSKSIFLQAGIKVPDATIVNKENIEEYLSSRKEFVLKPIDEGSSVGIIIARDGKYDLAEIYKQIEFYGKLLAEELIKGTEITVPVLGGKALLPVAIFPPKNEEFDLENKYNGKTREICPIPEDIVERKIQDAAKAIAQKAHQSIGARHISRTDMIVTPENDLVVLEINTMPGLTSQSLLPKSAKAAGMSFNHLTERFVKLSSGNNL